MIVDIKIILVNAFGENPYSQRVIVYPWQVSPDEEASSPDKDEVSTKPSTPYDIIESETDEENSEENTGGNS